ncbi:hypothetical protein JTB14_011433 [Gonioctena quinquepunctata]|nr:hypothetical protein JTB14_011433 [Gonioctena quinquepunctata]
MRTHLPPSYDCRRPGTPTPTSHIVLLSRAEITVVSQQFHVEWPQVHVDGSPYHKRWFQSAVACLTAVDGEEVRTGHFFDFEDALRFPPVRKVFGFVGDQVTVAPP